MSRIAPIQALFKHIPELFDSLTDAEKVVALHHPDLWLRPQQHLPTHDWRSCGLIAGRGWGKSFAVAHRINLWVEEGKYRSIALMAQNKTRIKEVQVAALMATAPPWFRPEPYGDGVRWPNGLASDNFTPEKPGRPRGGTYECSWMTEIVDWCATTRWEAYRNLSTATRGGKAHIFWDTTSKGRNEVIQFLVKQHNRDPSTHVLIRGSMYDNPLLSQKYLSSVVDQYVIGSQRYREEVWGEVFDEAAGALWKFAWIDDHRINEIEAAALDLKVIGLDPALSGEQTSDEVGMCLAGRRRSDGHVVILEDPSTHMPPEIWGRRIVNLCAKEGYSGAVIERNHAGDMPHTILKILAEKATELYPNGMTVQLLKPDQPFPQRTPGRIYVREVVSATSKDTRAQGPATLSESGRVHHLGHLSQLEEQQTNWIPGEGRSPNRLDAYVFAVIELAGLPYKKQIPDLVKQNVTADSHLRNAFRRMSPRRIGL